MKALNLFNLKFPLKILNFVSTVNSDWNVLGFQIISGENQFLLNFLIKNDDFAVNFEVCKNCLIHSNIMIKVAGIFNNS